MAKFRLSAAIIRALSPLSLVMFAWINWHYLIGED